METFNALQWIEEEKKHALELLQAWAAVNSWSENLQGLEEMAAVLEKAFAHLGDEKKIINSQPWIRRDEKGNLYESKVGNALWISKKGRKKILLGGHMDTVHSPASLFLNCEVKGNICIGPGVADMKGGLAILWLALSAFEKFFSHLDLGWDVLINGDEELGSPGSYWMWEERAKAAEVCLLFEPSFPDGALVDARKGAFNMSLFVKGKAAHAGRDIREGRSAVKAISRWITEAFDLTKTYPELSMNAAKLHSESPLNTVPAEARVSLNVRSFRSADLTAIQKDFAILTKRIEAEEGVLIQSHQDGMKLSKPCTSETEALFTLLNQCALELRMSPFLRRASGGLSDGNFTAAAGTPTLDTLGVIGGNLHTNDEYMEIASLGERAKLVLLFLYRYATKGII